ncbi:uncharacterized protein FOMMEDRAFT_166504 [Fomitiporia mediterranea MF3/22]|uniref:uncharacterized protein n=1 Tax=Fomitiporia mediterranea (strain MF3/22) TaxID=694068 RepID=UPI000440988D|nr:uncharacterized protein FOMMEDRAFT_166504 [Fomitiporia mediterranea MF3/22]EJD06269.1 hypothetical protein FOMMEDRAFT_166504 [Fomitiporia mediterranea MF3/22]
MPSDRTNAASSSSMGNQLDGEDQDLSSTSRAARKGGNPLQRGSACLSCRKRKMKCDATKPVCRQCVKANRAEECDYDDGRQKSRTQILQEKIAKLEDRIRELECADDEYAPEQQQQTYDPTYDAFGQATATTGFGGEDYSAAGTNGGAYGFAGSGVAPYHSPAESASASGSSNGQSFSPLILDGGTSTSTPSLSYHGHGHGPTAGPSSASLFPPGPEQQHQHHHQNSFYPSPAEIGNTSSAAADLFGFPSSPDVVGVHGHGGSGIAVASASTSAAGRPGSAGPSGSSSSGAAWGQQHEIMNMSSIFGPASTSTSVPGAGAAAASVPGMPINEGYGALDMGFDASMALGMNMSMNMNMNMGMNSSMAMGMGVGMPGDLMTMSGYGGSTHDFSAFSTAGPSSMQSSYGGQHANPNAMSSASSLTMRSVSSSLPFPSPASSSTSGAVPGPGPNSLSIPRTGGTGTRSTISLQTSLGKSSKPMSRWDVEVLHVQERKILADIFLPHAKQCGLDLSPERLYQRLELDNAYPTLFPLLASSQSQNQNNHPQGHGQQQHLQNLGELRAPPAHPALANAIYLLACHFSAVHLSGPNISTTSYRDGSSANGKQTDLSAHEPHFLTRALRGIAAALEAGEAAATDSPSSRSSRSSRSSTRSGSASARGSNSPRSEAGASPALRVQSRNSSRPSTSHNTASTSASTSTSTSAANLTAGITTGLGGGVPKEEEQLDTATPLVDAVQASALLAVYFFAKARLLEGYYHASAAARLAVSLGMHQVRSPVWRPPPPPTLAPATSPSPSFGSSSFGSTTFDSASSSSGSSGSAMGSSSSGSGSSGSSSGWSGTPHTSPSPAVLLAPARSALEHQERVSTFWSVFFVDRCWSIATGLPSSLPDDEHPQLKISTVWPWEGVITLNNRADAEYESLGGLFEVNSGEDMGRRRGGKNRCTKAFKVKAAAFFEKAARITSMQSEPTHWEQLTQLEYALNGFISTLPSYLSTTSSPSSSHSPSYSPVSTQTTVDVDLALTHTLAHTALIQLHHPRAQKDLTSHTICLRAASSCTQIIRHLQLNDYGLLDPVIGTCWMCVGDVLLRERSWGGDMSGVSYDVGRSRQQQECGEAVGVEAELECVVSALRQLSFVFPVALYQVQKVEQSRAMAF